MWLGHSCARPSILVYVWVGHSCPTKQAITARVGRTFLSDRRPGISTTVDVYPSQTAGSSQVHTSPSRIKPALSEVGGNVRATRSMHSTRTPLTRMYEYRRMLPHYQKANRAMFVTFCKNSREPFPPEPRDAILQCCLKGNGLRFHLHAAVIMPEHVHLLLTPMQEEDGWVYGLPAILKSIKGASARGVNKLTGSSGPVWHEESFDHVLRSQESFEDKLEYIRQNSVRRGLVKKPEDYPWLWVEQYLR